MAVAAWREMLPRDVEALLAFKRAASGFPQMLEEWDPDAAHPCDWRYVYCRCRSQSAPAQGQRRLCWVRRNCPRFCRGRRPRVRKGETPVELNSGGEAGRRS